MKAERDNMMRFYRTAAVVGAVLGAGFAEAHHSYAMFDYARDVTLRGTVREWDWTNPHTLLIMEVPLPGVGTVLWTIEGASPQVLRDKGWTRAIMKHGDQITVHLSPLRSGAKGGQLSSVLTVTGQIYKYR